MVRPLSVIVLAVSLAAFGSATQGETPENLWVKAEPDPAGGAAGRVQAGVDIPAPPAVVWRVMLDCERAPRFVPKLKSCTVLEGDAARGGDVREHRLAGPLGTVRNVFRSTYVRERSITTVRVGGDLKVAEGVWRLQPLDGGRATRVAYDSRMALNAPVPAAMVRSAMRRDTPEVLRALRREAVAAAG
jgi:ribosome-associated toxin RatA of RatAB toxin-antitoxin module